MNLRISAYDLRRMKLADRVGLVGNAATAYHTARPTWPPSSSSANTSTRSFALLFWLRIAGWVLGIEPRLLQVDAACQP